MKSISKRVEFKKCNVAPSHLVRPDSRIAELFGFNIGTIEIDSEEIRRTYVNTCEDTCPIGSYVLKDQAGVTLPADDPFKVSGSKTITVDTSTPFKRTVYIEL